MAGAGEQWLAPIATERNDMKDAALLISDEILWHETGISHPPFDLGLCSPTLRQMREGWGTRIVVLYKRRAFCQRLTEIRAIPSSNRQD